MDTTKTCYTVLYTTINSVCIIKYIIKALLYRFYACIYSQLLVMVTYFPYSGQLADRSNLRYFLTIGMLGGCGCDVMCDITTCVQSSWFLVTIGSSLSVGLFGMGYFLDVHKLYYYILVQVSM